MFIDIHSHILPSVDDGADSEQVTKAMLQTAFEEGITTIVATPHFVGGLCKNRKDEIYNKYEKVYKWWKSISPDNILCLGNELFYGENLIENLDKGYALTMNGTNYILVEFPVYADYPYIRRAVQTLMYAGYVPIIAHIERYQGLRKKNKVQELVEIGCFMQSNTSAILGRYGLKTKMFLLNLLKSSLLHFVATDAHSEIERSPQMKECALFLQKKLGQEMMEEILIKNPEKMLKGEAIE